MKRAKTPKINPASLLAIYRRFKHHLQPHARTAILAGVCMVAATLMELLKPWPLKLIFDGLLIPQANPDPFVGLAVEYMVTPERLLLAAVWAMLVVAVLGGLFSFGQSFLLARIGQQVVAAIRQQVYSHTQRLSMSFHVNRSSGDLLARLTNDVRIMRELLVNSGVFIAARSLVVLGTLTVMALMDWRLTLMAIVIMPVLGLTSRHFSVAIKAAARRQRRKESAVTSVMHESLGAIRVVQAYAREDYEDRRFARQNAASETAELASTRLASDLDRLVQVFLAVGTALVVGYGVIRIQAGALTPGDLLVFTAYLTALYKPIRKSASLTSRIAKATVSGERLLALLDTAPEIRDREGAVAAPAFKGEIQLHNVSFGYDPTKPVLDGVNLTIHAGERLALVSPSGSGKTTLANLLLRFHDPNSGSVTIDGVDIRDYTVASLRDQISVLLQESVLFADTIRNNIAYGRPGAGEEAIVAAAKAANADAFIRALPDGYDTVVGERGGTLSGGQRQRIAIARAMVRNTPILIVDEPMTGLDKENEQVVRDAFNRVMAGRTCIIISHDLETASMADRVLRIEGGKLVDLDLAGVIDFGSMLRDRRGAAS